jgi:hypothetical protein
MELEGVSAWLADVRNILSITFARGSWQQLVQGFGLEPDPAVRQTYLEAV